MAFLCGYHDESADGVDVGVLPVCPVWTKMQACRRHPYKDFGRERLIIQRHHLPDAGWGM